jgi:hypothetical protein
MQKGVLFPLNKHLLFNNRVGLAQQAGLEVFEFVDATGDLQSKIFPPVV